MPRRASAVDRPGARSPTRARRPRPAACRRPARGRARAPSRRERRAAAPASIWPRRGGATPPGSTRRGRAPAGGRRPPDQPRRSRCGLVPGRPRRRRSAGGRAGPRRGPVPPRRPGRRGAAAPRAGRTDATLGLSPTPAAARRSDRPCHLRLYPSWTPGGTSLNARCQTGTPVRCTLARQPAQRRRRGPPYETLHGSVQGRDSDEFTVRRRGIAVTARPRRGRAVPTRLERAVMRRDCLPHVVAALLAGSIALLVIARPTGPKRPRRGSRAIYAPRSASSPLRGSSQ